MNNLPKTFKITLIILILFFAILSGHDIYNYIKIKNLKMAQYNRNNPNLVYAELFLKGIDVEIKSFINGNNHQIGKMIIKNDGIIFRHTEEYIIIDPGINDDPATRLSRICLVVN